MKINCLLGYLNWWKLISSLLLVCSLSSCQQKTNADYESFKNYTTEIHQFTPKENATYIVLPVVNYASCSSCTDSIVTKINDLSLEDQSKISVLLVSDNRKDALFDVKKYQKKDSQIEYIIDAKMEYQKYGYALVPTVFKIKNNHAKVSLINSITDFLDTNGAVLTD